MILIFAAWSLGALVVSALALFVVPRLGSVGKSICDRLAVAPLLDIVVFAFVHGPWIAAWIIWLRLTDRSAAAFFAYLGTAIATQIVALTFCSWGHELLHPGSRRGPRIVSTLNRRVGAFRNHAAVWWTALAVPLFTAVRIGELVIYPPLTWLVRLPRYKTGEWVNVSRQKFSGLVGWDLIWCLYCDWMTGVWSLGSEMLRNVESFWCPLRFSSPEKCANCSIDFPDVATHWISPPAPGSSEGMEKAAALLEKSYPGPTGVNAWYGHEVRLTVSAKKSGDVNA